MHWYENWYWWPAISLAAGYVIFGLFCALMRAVYRCHWRWQAFLKNWLIVPGEIIYAIAAASIVPWFWGISQRWSRL